MQMKTIRSSNPVVRNALRIRNAAAITIKPSPTADTRSADHEVTIDELRKSSEQHIGDVCKGMDYVASLLRKAGERHDFTKTKYLKEFFDDFRRAQETGVWTNGWFDRIHKVQERHHLNDRVPEDVNLIDVIEHIVDCVMAGKGRAGEFKPDALGSGILERAYQNTQKLIADAVTVKQENA